MNGKLIMTFPLFEIEVHTIIQNFPPNFIFSFHIRKLKIGYYLTDGRYSPHPGCQRAVKEAVTTLRKMGHTVIEVSQISFTKFKTYNFVENIFFSFIVHLRIGSTHCLWDY